MNCNEVFPDIARGLAKLFRILTQIFSLTAAAVFTLRRNNMKSLIILQLSPRGREKERERTSHKEKEREREKGSVLLFLLKVTSPVIHVRRTQIPLGAFVRERSLPGILRLSLTIARVRTVSLVVFTRSESSVTRN